MYSCVGRQPAIQYSIGCGDTLGAGAGGEKVGNFLGPRPAALAIRVVHAEGTLVACGAAS